MKKANVTRLQKKCNLGVNPLMLVLGVISALVLILACSAALADAPPPPNSAVLRLNESWQASDGTLISLPVRLTDRDERQTFSLTLPQKLPDGSLTLFFAAKYLNVYLYLDGVPLGSCLCGPGESGDTLGKVTALLALPPDAGGQQLQLEVEPLLGAGVQYEVAPPLVGTGGSILLGQLRSELLLLVVITAIFCFGVLLLFFSSHTRIPGEDRPTHDTTFFQTGIFAMVFALYSLVITDSIHLYFSNSYLIYLLEFLLLALLPLPLLALALEVCLPQFRRLLRADICAVALNVCVQAALHFFSPLELRNTVSATHVLMGISALLLTVAVVQTVRVERARLGLLASFAPVLIGALLDLFRFYLPDSGQKAMWFQLGVLIFILLQSIYLIRSYLSYYENNLKSSVYRQMAYTDAMTELGNRAAFEDKIVEIRKNYNDYSAIWCLSADINGLKQVNDTLGHTIGDQLIRAAAAFLRTTFGDTGRIYRTGGDEFVLFVMNESAETVLERKACFFKALEEYNQTHVPALSIALGMDRLRDGGEDTITNLLSRADALMYQNKRKMKTLINPCEEPTAGGLSNEI